MNIRRNRGLILAAVIIGLFAYISTERVKVWRNSETLWRDSLKKDNTNYLAHYMLGWTLTEQSRLDEAIDEFLTVIKIFDWMNIDNVPETDESYASCLQLKFHPLRYMAWDMLGSCFWRQGNKKLAQFAASNGKALREKREMNRKYVIKKSTELRVP